MVVMARYAKGYSNKVEQEEYDKVIILTKRWTSITFDEKGDVCFWDGSYLVCRDWKDRVRMEFDKDFIYTIILIGDDEIDFIEGNAKSEGLNMSMEYRVSEGGENYGEL